MNSFNELFQAAESELGGLLKFAAALGVTHPSLIKWRSRGCLPHTDHSGETDYADRIELVTNGVVKAADLLAASRRTYVAKREAKAAA